MKKKIVLDITRRLTQTFHCAGTTCSGWKSCATALVRCQVHDRKQFGRRDWSNYPSDRWGWITDTGRCIGVGKKPAKNVLNHGELLIAIPIPFEGSGKTLNMLAEGFVHSMNKAAKRRRAK